MDTETGAPVDAFQLSSERFAELREKLGDHYTKSLELFRHYSTGRNGTELSFALVTALTEAANHGKIPEVLEELESHWNQVLRHQHPQIRGASGILGSPLSSTQLFFKRIFVKIIGLTTI